MKKMTVLMMALVLSVMMLTGCTSTQAPAATEAPTAEATVEATVEASAEPVVEATAEAEANN